MRRFYLDRLFDISGVSGVGRVAEGVVFEDGQVALSWRGRFHTLEIARSIDDIIAIHSHSGATEVVWVD